MTVNSLSLHFLQHHPQDAARILEQFEPAQLANYLEQTPPASIANVLRYMTAVKVVSCLVEMDVNIAAKILEQFSIERTSSLLRRIQSDVRIKIINAMSTLYANMIKLVMKYPENTVGRFMSPNVFTAYEDMRVSEVLSTIKDSADQIRSEIFVVNEKQRLVGMVFIRDLFVADPKISLGNIMRSAPGSISSRSRLDNVQDNSAWKYNDMLPVVDRNGLFMGVLKRGVMLDALERNIDKTHEQDDLVNTALNMAALFWDTCSELMAPEIVQNNKESQDGNNK